MTPRILFVIGIVLIFFAAIIATEEGTADQRPLITKFPPRGTAP